MTGTVEIHNVTRGATFTVGDGTTTKRIAPGQRVRMDAGTIGGGAVTLTVTEVVKPTAGQYGPLDKPDT